MPNRRKHQLLAIILGLYVLAQPLLVAANERAALDILQSMVVATVAKNYDGVFVYMRGDRLDAMRGIELIQKLTGASLRLAQLPSSDLSANVLQRPLYTRARVVSVLCDARGQVRETISTPQRPAARCPGALSTGRDGLA